ncbi:MAG: hypothetical protein ACPGQL_09265 [Thermoplasmatota archaeon]
MATLRHGAALLGVVLLLAAGLSVQPANASVGPLSALYVIDGFATGTNTLHTVDTTTAVPSAVGPVALPDDTPTGLTDNGATIFTFTFDPSRLVSIDPLTAAATDVAPFFPVVSAEGSLAYHPGNGLLYGICAICPSARLASIAPDGGGYTDLGELTYLGAPLGGGNIDGADFRGNTLYGVAGHGAGALTNHLVMIDTATGVITDVGDLAPADVTTFLAGLAYSPHEDLFYLVERDGTLFTVDPDTAAATLVGETGLSDVSGATYLGVASPPSTPNVFSCNFPDDARNFRVGQVCLPGQAVGDKTGGSITHHQSGCRYFYNDGTGWDRIRARTFVPDGSEIAIYCLPFVTGKVEMVLGVL